MATSYKEFIAELTKAGAFGRQPNPNPQVLDAADLNLGASFEMPPMNKSNTVQVPIPKRFLSVDGPGPTARCMTVVMGQFIDTPRAASQAIAWGPITGLIEFGSGASFATVEFDVPELSQVPYPTLTGLAPKAFEPFASKLNNYISIVVPGSSVRVYARNDATAPLNLDQNGTLTPPPALVPEYSNPSVFAFISYDQTYGSQAQSRLKKSVRIACSSNGSLVSFQPGMAFAARCGIPAFARSVSFPRQPVSQPLLVEAYSLTRRFTQQEFIPAGQSGKIELCTDAAILNIVNTGDEPISNLNAVFDLVI